MEVQQKAQEVGAAIDGDKNREKIWQSGGMAYDEGGDEYQSHPGDGGAKLQQGKSTEQNISNLVVDVSLFYFKNIAFRHFSINVHIKLSISHASSEGS